MEYPRFVPVIWPAGDAGRQAIARQLSENGPRNGCFVDAGSGMCFRKFYGRLDLCYRSPVATDAVLLVDPPLSFFLESVWSSLIAEVPVRQIHCYLAVDETALPCKMWWQIVWPDVSDEIYVKGFRGSDLILATRRNDPDMVKALICSGARDTPDIHGDTAVYEAAMLGSALMLQDLIKCHADVNIPRHLDATTPLIQATWVACHEPEVREATLCYAEAIKLLVHARADVRARDGCGKRACDYARGAIADTLSELSPMIIKKSATGDLDGLCSVLKSRADPNAIDAWLCTGLHLAARNGHETVVQTLIESRADVGMVCGMGYTALEWAQWKQRHEVIARLTAEKFSVGDAVEFHSLQHARELNGKRGEIIEFDAQTSRYLVRMNGSSNIKAVNARNIKQKHLQSYM
eukprot:TRINITY_DN39278_c0_g1_i1.p1 TRINITY_DN39278_c0_g1~~TRINITY_DN39278_c0_g1_i1.p1  ORF type:complete len:406 (+),score=58.34 TRINITY_DN39278_c0_g1_i1:84-1301(+)